MRIDFNVNEDEPPPEDVTEPKRECRQAPVNHGTPSAVKNSEATDIS